MEDYKAQLAQKGKEVEELQEKNVMTSRELAYVQGRLFWSEKTQKYLMTIGMGKTNLVQ